MATASGANNAAHDLRTGRRPGDGRSDTYAAAMKFDQYTIVLLVRRPDAPEFADEEATVVQDAHLASQADLYDKGHLVAAGPFVRQDDERLRGIAILNVGVKEAQRLYESDPAVQAGRLAVEVMTWMVPSGIVRFDNGRLPRSMAEAVGG
jgi:uncharacterized protein